MRRHQAGHGVGVPGTTVPGLGEGHDAADQGDDLALFDIQIDAVQDDRVFIAPAFTWKPNDDVLLYGTWSRGFRPGGINRRGTLPPYPPDFIDNYELGFKTSWANNTVRFNGAIYQLDWKDIQLSFLGANGLTEIRSAGNARIRGAEFDIFLRPVRGLTVSLVSRHVVFEQVPLLHQLSCGC